MGGDNSKEESVATVQRRPVGKSTEVAKPARRRHRGHYTMAAGRKSICLGSINVSIVKGDISTEKADVIICTASKSLNLSKGRASKVLMDAAGESIQKDCSSNYPDGIDSDEIAMVSPGKLSCRKVYFVAPPVHSSSGEEVQTLKDIVTECLSNASQHGSQTLAIPALGTGFLRYPAKLVASTMLKCIEDFSNANQSSSLQHIGVIVFHKDLDTYKAFESEVRRRAPSCQGNCGASGGSKSKTISDFTSLGLQSILAARPKVTADSIGDVRVSIVVGKLATCEADVIVDNTAATLKLDNGGLSESLLEEAGSQLQEDCDDNYPDGVTPGNIAITDGYNLACSQVYHGSLPKWDKSYKSKNILCEFVCKCLKQANNDEHTSIAFPTLGTGSLNYPADVAAKTMFQCIMKHANDTSLTDITIVVYNGGDKWKQIKTVFEQEMANCRDKNTPATLDIDSDSTEEESETEVEFVVPVKFKQLTRPPPKLVRGSSDWFKQMYKNEPRTPNYWSVFNNQNTLKDWNAESEDLKPCLTRVDTATFKVISKVIEDTWLSQFVGHGRDAVGLGNLDYSSIKVTKIERIENTKLFEKYAQRRQDLLLKAAKSNGFKSLERVPGSSNKLMTTDKVSSGSVLTSDMFPEINEHYLFHGTKEGLVDTIVHQGLDNRVSGTGAMFGSGIYGAESSTKADQYADVKSSRSFGEKKMFLIRMCLGDIFIQKTAHAYVRPPCRSCQKDVCTCKDATLFDSVVGDGSWNFREFVIYDRNQTYPEYVISYARQL